MLEGIVGIWKLTQHLLKGVKHREGHFPGSGAVNDETQADVGFDPHDGEECFHTMLIPQFSKELAHNLGVFAAYL